MSPSRIISNNTRNITRSRYDPPSVPSTFQQSNTTSQPENNNNNNQQTSSRYYDPFNYSFFPSTNTIIQVNSNQNFSQSNNNNNLMTHRPAYSLQTNASQKFSFHKIKKFPIQKKFNFLKEDLKLLHFHIYLLMTYINLYQMNQHTTYNPTTNLQPVNMVQSAAPPLQYMPFQQDTFISTSSSIPKPIKPFDGLDHSYTPEEYLQQVEAILTFDIREEPQSNPVKYRSWHSFVQLFKKQFSSQKTAYYAQVEAMSFIKKHDKTVRLFALRVQQLVKKGLCNENAATTNLKNNEIFTKGLPKKLKVFAHKRRDKHVSTVLESSIQFHTLV